MTPAIARFDYSPLPATQVDELRAMAKTIRSGTAMMTAAIIDIGRNLLAAKQALAHGRFSPWVEAECGFTLRTAQNYMRVAEFTHGKSETVSLLSPSVIYTMASKKVPLSVVNKVLQLLDSGQVPTECDVLRMLAEAREIKPERSQILDTGLEAQRADDLASRLLASVGPDLARSLAEGPWDQIGVALRLKLNPEFASSSEPRRSDNSATNAVPVPTRVDLVPDFNDADRYRPKVIEGDYDGIPTYLDRKTWASGAIKQVEQVSSCPPAQAEPGQQIPSQHKPYRKHSSRNYHLGL